MGARPSKLRGRARQGELLGRARQVELLGRARQVSSWAPSVVALVAFKPNGVVP